MQPNFRPGAAALAVAAAFPIAAPAADQATAELAPVVISAPADRDPWTGAERSGGDLASQRARTSDTASLLRDVPGVNLQGAGGVSSLPVVNGLAGDRVRTQVDGMDLIASCPNHMNPPLSYIDPTAVESLKVYAGISPVSAGGDSIAGTIVARSREPRFAESGQNLLFTGEAGAFYRSNGDAYGANVTATVASESLSLTYTGAMAQSDNYKAGGDFKNYTATGVPGHTLARDTVGSTAYETRNHMLGLAMKGGRHLVEAKVGFQDVPFENYPNQRMDMTDNQQLRFNLRYLGKQDWGTLEARAWHEKVDHKMDFGGDKRFWYSTNSGGPEGPNGRVTVNGYPCAIGNLCAAGMPMETESHNSGLALKGDIRLGARDLLRVGGEHQQYRLDDWWPPSGSGMWPNDFININGGKRDRTALFGEWEAAHGLPWTTSLGLRYERVKTDAGLVHGYNLATAPTSMPAGMDMMSQNRDAVAFNNADRSKTDHNWNLTAIARYTKDDTQDIEFGFARKVRSPNLYERYTWSTSGMMAGMNNFVGDGNGYFGDINLKPEKAHTLSATFDWHTADRSWEFKATPFYTHVDDYIDAIQWNATANVPQTSPAVRQFSVLRYANQDARLYGLDLSGRMPLGKTGFGDFGLKGQLNYTHGRNRDTGDDLYNIMPLNARLTLTHQSGGWDNGIELVAVKGKRNGSDVRNEIETSGYSLVNLRSSYSWKQVRFDFGVDNLFDRLYYHPLGGAYTGQGRTMSLNPPASDGMFGWGTAVPGMGRSIYAGVTYKF